MNQENKEPEKDPVEDVAKKYTHCDSRCWSSIEFHVGIYCHHTGLI